MALTERGRCSPRLLATRVEIFAGNSSGELNKQRFGRALLALPSLAARVHFVPKFPRPRSRNSLGDAAKVDSTALSVVEELSQFTLGEPEKNRPAWTPDTGSVSCQGCGTPFHCHRRRHHCRACGELVCSRCARRRLTLVVMAYDTPVRVCNTCHDILCPPRALNKSSAGGCERVGHVASNPVAVSPV